MWNIKQLDSHLTIYMMHESMVQSYFLVVEQVRISFVAGSS